ncbi:hypothetical protein TNCV_534321 [Trichonephila clavipes]|nr:hypothetical protein TNCV_534321 [Trichonephila clavipes]
MVGFGEFGQANVRRDLRLPDNCSPGNDSRCCLGRKSSGCKMTGIVGLASASVWGGGKPFNRFSKPFVEPRTFLEGSFGTE